MAAHYTSSTIHSWIQSIMLQFNTFTSLNSSSNVELSIHEDFLKYPFYTQLLCPFIPLGLSVFITTIIEQICLFMLNKFHYTVDLTFIAWELHQPISFTSWTDLIWWWSVYWSRVYTFNFFKNSITSGGERRFWRVLLDSNSDGDSIFIRAREQLIFPVKWSVESTSWTMSLDLFKFLKCF